ncbi:MAG TPA: dTMP kinase [Candidatus Dormibacteraeota bacterium]
MGLFLTFEGPEGSGKTTQARRLWESLGAASAILHREPGGTALGEAIRNQLLHSGPMAPAAEMYLFMAARAELLHDVVEPALATGRTVILDRYHDSTLAYQGGGRGLDPGWPAWFRKPDRTYLLRVPPEVGLRRSGERSELDRLESEPLAFHRAVAEAYDRLAAAEPERFLVLDGATDSDRLHEGILEDVRKLQKRLAASNS